MTLPFFGAFRFLQGVVTHFFRFRKNKSLIGYYLVCGQNGNPYINSPEKIPNFLRIDISVTNPNVLQIVSKDFDRHYTRIWKTWTGQIEMKGMSGEGPYIYSEGAEPGQHKIYLKNNDTILVRVIDHGKANLAKGTDNEPATQVWKRVHDNDPLIDTFKSIMGDT